MAPPEDDLLGGADDVDTSSWPSDILALLEPAGAALEPVRVAMEHSDHAFYMVLKTSFSHRYLQYHDARRSMKIAVLRLHLESRVDGIPFFRGRESSRIEHLDLQEVVSRVGLAAFLRDIHIWSWRAEAQPTLQIQDARQQGALQHNAAGRATAMDLVVRSLLASQSQAWLRIEAGPAHYTTLDGTIVEVPTPEGNHK